MCWKSVIAIPKPRPAYPILSLILIFGLLWIAGWHWVISRGQFPKILEASSVISFEVATIALSAALAYFLISRERSFTEEVHNAATEIDARCNAVFENSAAGMAIVSSDGIVLHANRAVCDMLGRSPAEVVGRKVCEFTHPDDRIVDQQLLDQLIEDRNIGPSLHEKRFVHGNKSIRWVSKVTTLIRAVDGSPDYFLAVLTDVSERKTAELALQKSEERFRLAMLGANDGLWDLDLVANTFYLSPRWLTMLGLEPGQISNFDQLLPLIHAEDADNFLKSTDAWLRGSQAIYEHQFRMRHKKGHFVHLMSRAYCVRDATGQAIRAVGIDLDISERVLAESVFVRNKQRLRQALEIAELGWFEHDLRSGEYSSSPRYRAIIGWRDNLDFGFQDMINVTHPEDRKRTIDAIASAHDLTSDGIYSHERRIILPEGGVRWIRTRAQTIFADVDGKRTALRVLGVNQDITEKKQDEEEARLWQRLFDKSNLELYCDDAKTHRIIAASEAFADARGFEATALRGKLACEFYRVSERDTVRKHLEIASSLGHVSFESSHICYDGSEMPVRAEISVLCDQHGKPEIRIAHFTNLSALKAAHSALYDHESLHLATITTLSEGVVVVDRNCKIVSLNPAARAMLKIPPTTTIQRLEPLSALPWIREDGTTYSHEELPVRNVLATGLPIQSVIVGDSRPGLPVTWLSINARPLETAANEFAGAVVVTFTDVTQSRAEKQIKTNLVHNLAESEKKVAVQQLRFETVFDSTPDGVMLINLQRQFTHANPALCSMLGYLADELTGSETKLIYAHDSDWTRVGEHLFEVTMTGGAYTGIFNFKRKCGDIFSGRMNGAPLRDGSGTIIGYVGVVRDISEEQRRQRVATETQRLESLGRLTGGIAHDFNNLLTVINANLQLARMMTPGTAIEKKLLAAEQASELGARLNQRLMSFARQRQMEPEITTLNKIIEDMVPIIKGSLTDAFAVALKISLDMNLAPVNIDVSQVENAVLNITLNALDSMPDGGSLSFKTSNLEIGPQNQPLYENLKPGHYVLLEIADAGTGMPPEVLSKSIEPFFTTKNGGTGLGLATVHGFVKQSGGSLKISSTPISGTTVQIILPAATENDQFEAAPNMKSLVRNRRGTTILIVEDSARVREPISEGLINLGYLVVEADNAKQALELIKSNHKIDLVFTDVVLPGGMSGVDLATAVHDLNSDLAVILTTGNIDALAHQPREFESVISKPYTLASLTEMINHVLNEFTRVSKQ